MVGVCVEWYLIQKKGGRVGIWAPAHWGLGEIDWLLVPSGKASNLLSDCPSDYSLRKLAHAINRDFFSFKN